MDPHWMNSDERSCRSTATSGIALSAHGIFSVEAKRRLRAIRLTSWMKPGIHAIIIAILTAALATGTLVCPLWMTSNSHADMACSPEHDAPQRCPVSICQASSPYLIDGVITDIFPGPALLPEPVDSATSSISLGSRRQCQECDDGSPPGVTGRLFLQTGALLI
jgi:hypothetical protein